MDDLDVGSLANLLAEAAGTTVNELRAGEIEEMIDADIATAEAVLPSVTSAGPTTALASKGAAGGGGARRAVVASAPALALNQYLGQHPVFAAGQSKAQVVFAATTEYPEASDGEAAQGAAPPSEVGVMRQWMGAAQERLELERLAAVFEDPVAALNASLRPLHATAAMADTTSATGAPLPLTDADLRECEGCEGPAHWARAVLGNSLARAAAFVVLGPLAHTHLVVAPDGAPLAPRTALDTPPAFGTAADAARLSCTEAWVAAARRIARDVYDREAWVVLLAEAAAFPLPSVRHVWLAFAFYFPTCGQLLCTYLRAEMALLQGSSDSFATPERCKPFSAVNGLRDGMDASEAKRRFEGLLRIANTFARHLPLCASPALYHLFFEFAFNYMPVADASLLKVFKQCLEWEVGDQPSSTGIWRVFIRWQGAKQHETMALQGRGATHTAREWVRKLYQHLLSAPMADREELQAEYTAFEQAALRGTFRLDDELERKFNKAKSVLADANGGWSLWKQLPHGEVVPTAAQPQALVQEMDIQLTAGPGAMGAVGATPIGGPAGSIGWGEAPAAAPAEREALPVEQPVLHMPVPVGHRSPAWTGPNGAMSTMPIPAELRFQRDAEGCEHDVRLWQRWRLAAKRERDDNDLSLRGAAHARRVIAFLRWRVASFPHHAPCHLQLIEHILSCAVLPMEQRRTLAREALEQALRMIPDSPLLAAEAARLLGNHLGEEMRGHVVFRTAVERCAGQLLALRREPMPAPLGLAFLEQRFPGDATAAHDPSHALGRLGPEDVAEHAATLDAARRHAARSLGLVRRLASLCGLWLRWARCTFRVRARENMRLVARHIFGAMNVVLVVTQEVQRLYKGLALPFFVDPVAAAARWPYAPVPALLAGLLDHEGGGATEVFTCGRGADDGHLVFAPKHFFAAVNALCAEWVRLECGCGDHGEGVEAIFQTWTRSIGAMLRNTAPRHWSPADCGMDRGVLAAAEVLLRSAPTLREHVLECVAELARCLPPFADTERHWCDVFSAAFAVGAANAAPAPAVFVGQPIDAEESNAGPALLVLADAWAAAGTAAAEAFPPFASPVGLAAHCGGVPGGLRGVAAEALPATAAARLAYEAATSSDVVGAGLVPFLHTTHPAIAGGGRPSEGGAHLGTLGGTPWWAPAQAMDDAAAMPGRHGAGLLGGVPSSAGPAMARVAAALGIADASTAVAALVQPSAALDGWSAGEEAVMQSPIPLAAGQWMPFRLPVNERLLARERQLSMRGGRGRGRGRGRGGRGRGGSRGGGGAHTSHNNGASLLRLAEAEDQQQLVGERDLDGGSSSGEDEPDGAAEAADAFHAPEEGVYAADLKTTQYARGSLSIARNPYARSLEHHMDLTSLLLAGRREEVEREAHAASEAEERRERQRGYEERDKRLRAEQVFAAPADAPSAIAAQLARVERAVTAAHAQPRGGVQQSALRAAERLRQRIAGVILAKEYPLSDVWVPQPLEHNPHHTASDPTATGTDADAVPSGGAADALPSAHHGGALAADRGNGPYAPLHHLLLALQHHTAGPIDDEAGPMTADAVLALLRDTPSLAPAALPAQV